MEWISIVIGTGGIVGIITAYLTYRTSKSERRIQWYDRAIAEIERLEKKLQECQDRYRELETMYLNEKRKNDILKNRGDYDV